MSVKGWLEVADDAFEATLIHNVTMFIFKAISQADVVNINSLPLNKLLFLKHRVSP
jgi:hypothetical protein